MLVLTRKIDQGLVLHTTDGPIEVTLLKVKTNTCRVGIKAPTHVKVLRKELPLETEHERR